MVIKNQNAIAGIEEVSTSWRRCLSEHGVDPDSNESPRILTDYELKEFRGPVEELVAAAREENDRLHAIVGKVGYAVFFASSDGIVVDSRLGIWSEHMEGTNGIGTCIAEQRPVTVHRVQHFRTRHTGLSCSGAPIFDPDGGSTSGTRKSAFAAGAEVHLTGELAVCAGSCGPANSTSSTACSTATARGCPCSPSLRRSRRPRSAPAISRKPIRRRCSGC